MLFRVYEHYNDDYENIFQEQYNNCFICFEYKNDFENNPTTLHKQQLYFSNCNCNGTIHNNCLKIWLDINQSCPICRNIIIVKNKNVISILRFIPFGIQIYSFSKKLYNNYVLRFLFVFLFCDLFLKFYLLVFKNIYIFSNNFTYINTPILEEDIFFYNVDNVIILPRYHG